MLQRIIVIASVLTLSVAPRVVQISPDKFGGWVKYSSEDYSFCVGESWDFHEDSGEITERIWVWTEETGPVFIDEMLPLPRRLRILGMRWTDPNYYVLHIRGCFFTSYAASDDYTEYLVYIPRNTADWHSPGDFDFDWDIDQSDFGLLQAALGSKDMKFDLNNDGVIDVKDIDVFKRLIDGSR